MICKRILSAIFKRHDVQPTPPPPPPRPPEPSGPSDYKGSLPLKMSRITFEKTYILQYTATKKDVKIAIYLGPGGSSISWNATVPVNQWIRTTVKVEGRYKSSDTCMIRNIWVDGQLVNTNTMEIKGNSMNYGPTWNTSGQTEPIGSTSMCAIGIEYSE